MPLDLRHRFVLLMEREKRDANTIQSVLEDEFAEVVGDPITREESTWANAVLDEEERINLIGKGV
jgi:hypothetical protein